MPTKCPAVSGRFYPSLYLPGWPSPAFDQLVVQELGQVTSSARPPALWSAIVAITRRCALRCEHCLEWDVLNRAEGMSAEELQTVVQQLRRRGLAQLFLSGGEPLQRFEVLLELVASVAGEVDVWVLSSGRGLTREKAQRLAEAGLTGVALSLDHWDAAAHDAFRGRPGSFDAVTTAAGEVRNAGLVLALSLCPVRSFISPDDLKRYANLAHSLGASFIQILEPKAVGHYAGQDVALDAARQEELERFVHWLNRAPEARKLPVASYLDAEARLNGCSGGSRYAYVDTEGALHACPFCRDHPISLVGRDTEAAFAGLQAAGCPSHASRCSTRSQL